MTVPLDRRVWLECQALRDRGYNVAVICPKGPGDPGFETFEGIELHKYEPAPPASGLPTYLYEFAYSWVRTAILSVKAYRRSPFAVIQACNPPDTYWLLARMWRLRSVKFVYDQHDLNPELFLSRFGQPQSLFQRLQLSGLAWLERATYRAADRVISTNESYRRVALRRGGRRPEEVTVVRSGPDTAQMRPVYPPDRIRDGAAHLLVYLGIMGPQDNVDQLLLLADELVHRRDRRDIRVALLGFGDCLEDLKSQAEHLDLMDNVVFTGRVGPSDIAVYLSGADVGLGPDLRTPLNDVSTMNKTMEYMAYCLPMVAFDLIESRNSAGDTAIFVEPGDIAAMADAVELLLEDAALRVAMGSAARDRVTAELDWSTQVGRYIQVFDDLVGLGSLPDSHGGATRNDVSPWTVGRTVVDLEDRVELERFIRERTALPVASSSTFSAGSALAVDNKT